MAETHTTSLQTTPPVVGAIVGAAATPGYRPIEIRLVAGNAGVACNFWLGLARRGPESPARLMDYEDVAALFTEAATVGVSEQGPLILSDTSVDPSRFIFLMPVPDTQPGAQERWLDEVMKTLRSWAPGSAGLYIAPELLAGTAADDLLKKILGRLVEAGKTDEIFLLVGTHGMNALLNVVLSLKSELDGDDVKLFIFH